MDFHLEVIPSIGTFSAWRFSGGDVKLLCWHSHGSSGLEVMVFRVRDDGRACFLDGTNLLSGDSQSKNKQKFYLILLASACTSPVLVFLSSILLQVEKS